MTGVASSCLLLRPAGRIDRESCSHLRHQLGAAFAAGVRAVVVDLRDVVALDPVGLGVLSGAARHLRKKGGVLVVTHAAPAVLRTLRVNGHTHLLEIPPSPPMRGLPGQLPAAPRARRARSAVRPLTAVPDEQDPGLALPG